MGCEFSGVVRRAFREAGHDAWSCDVLPAEDESEYHIQDDVRNHLDGWDMGIFHPPCTRLTIAGAAYYDKFAAEREEAIEFFLALQNAPIPKIAIENPTPFKSVMERIGRYQQKINPFEFGEPIRKGICLWLKNLPPLFATEIIEVKPTGSCIRKSGPRAGKRYNYYYHQGKNGHARSRFFPGVAAAMANQWGKINQIEGD